MAPLRQSAPVTELRPAAQPEAAAAAAAAPRTAPPQHHRLEASAAELFLMGRRVRVKGLQQRPDLNGLCGTITSPGTSGGRFEVRIDERGEPSLSRTHRPTQSPDPIARSHHRATISRRFSPWKCPHHAMPSMLQKVAIRSRSLSRLQTSRSWTRRCRPTSPVAAPRNVQTRQNPNRSVSCA